MKHSDKLIVQALCQSVEGLPTEEAVVALFKRGLFSQFQSERLLVRTSVARMESEGVNRFSAFRLMADVLGCSLSKIKNLYY